MLIALGRRLERFFLGVVTAEKIVRFPAVSQVENQQAHPRKALENRNLWGITTRATPRTGKPRQDRKSVFGKRFPGYAEARLKYQ
jgi:hypothetical protein